MKLFDFGAEAHGVIAIGQSATGVIAIGQMATGVIAIGQLARGVVAVGQLAVGLGSLGMLSLGLVHSTGMLSVGAFARGLLKVPLMPKWERVAGRALTPLALIASGAAAQGWVAGTLRAQGGAFTVRERVTGRELPVDPAGQTPTPLLEDVAGRGQLPRVNALVVSREQSAGDDRGGGYRDPARVERELACAAVEPAPVPPWQRTGWLLGTAVRLVALAILTGVVYGVGAGPALDELVRAFQ